MLSINEDNANEEEGKILPPITSPEFTNVDSENFSPPVIDKGKG